MALLELAKHHCTQLAKKQYWVKCSECTPKNKQQMQEMSRLKNFKYSTMLKSKRSSAKFY